MAASALETSPTGYDIHSRAHVLRSGSRQLRLQATELLTSYVPGEGGPSGFNARLGFVPRGDVDPDGEIILRLDLHD